jgi:hypothetical protein
MFKTSQGTGAPKALSAVQQKIPSFHTVVKAIVEGKSKKSKVIPVTGRGGL